MLLGLSIKDRFLTIYDSKDQAAYFRKCSSPWKTVDVNQDCAGTWSSCTSKCETAEERKFTQTQPKWGSGAACPAAANDCDHAEGECKTGNKK
jgi:hypothetical protein